MSDTHQHSSNLKAARAGSLKNSVQNAKKNIKAALNIGSLITYIDPFIDWLFAIALIFAIIKDILDIPDEALIAAYGSGEILIIITTIICSLAIGFIMLLTGSSGKGKFVKGLLKRFGLLIGATIVEIIPGIDSLPLESVSVIAIVWMTLVERKKAAEKEKVGAQTQSGSATT